MNNIKITKEDLIEMYGVNTNPDSASQIEFVKKYKKLKTDNPIEYEAMTKYLKDALYDKIVAYLFLQNVELEKMEMNEKEEENKHTENKIPENIIEQVWLLSYKICNLQLIYNTNEIGEVTLDQKEFEEIRRIAEILKREM